MGTQCVFGLPLSRSLQHRRWHMSLGMLNTTRKGTTPAIQRQGQHAGGQLLCWSSSLAAAGASSTMQGHPAASYLHMCKCCAPSCTAGSRAHLAGWSSARRSGLFRSHSVVV